VLADAVVGKDLMPCAHVLIGRRGADGAARDRWCAVEALARARVGSPVCVGDGAPRAANPAAGRGHAAVCEL
jgi:hypothetical protein